MSTQFKRGAAPSRNTIGAGAVVTALAANPARRGALVQNTGAGNIRLTEGSTAPTASIGFVIVPNAFYEVRGNDQVRVFAAAAGSYEAIEF